MNENAKRFASYWRNSLADATLAKGGLDERTVKNFIKCNSNIWKNGQINNELTKQLFTNEPDDIKTIEVVLRPKVYRKQKEHTFTSKNIPEYVVPIASSALLSREGKLYPIKNETFISRDILEPLGQGSFSIGLLKDLDIYLTSNDMSGIYYVDEEQEKKNREDEDYIESPQDTYNKAWKSYMEDCKNLLEAVAKEWLKNTDPFVLLDFGYIIKKNLIKGAITNILPLYDKLRELSDDTDTPLFDNFSSIQPTQKKSCNKFESNSCFSKRLAHSSDTFPLADAQKEVLQCLLAANNGEILAVNGPPGTGKTTLLLSVVASLWAKSALEKKAPPIIVAASTNNQAVTNIIDAFGKDFSTGSGSFAGRWMPKINSFGAYYSSQAKSDKAGKIYQTKDFFKQIETQDYYNVAKQYYIQCAKKAFPNLSKMDCKVNDIVTKIVTEIHNEMKKEVASLERIKNSWENLSTIRKKINEDHGEVVLIEIKDKYEKLQQNLLEEKNIWQNIKDSWQEYLIDENICYAIFTWIPPVKQKRLLKAHSYLKKIWPANQDPQGWQSINSISPFIENKIEDLKKSISENEKKIEDLKKLIKKEEECLEDWCTALQPLDITNETQSITIEQADNFADTKIRFRIFLLTTHYWEGQWLIDIEKKLPALNDNWERKKGKDHIKECWNLRMKLTPCIVSTFFMLPSEFEYVGYNYANNYLYNFADLLIVDEAGQVLPEVAGASFALSKKALVIGDTHQIEPIWSIPDKVDIGNLQTAKIICTQDIEAEYETLKKLGKPSANGSVMKIAQQASRYHREPTMEPGMFLYEHRRCYDEIIGFCNELVYDGRLKPMRGSISPEEAIFPPMGYLHIDGICQQTSSGSRFNKLEATVIAKWLAENQEKIENKYNEPIHKIVGIITPFGSQVAEIKKAIKKLESNIKVEGEENSLTVGTIHSLQGAERKIIIFSTVYSKHANGNFIDENKSMLNVAVSRAKDSFLVFGDMDILDPSSAKPRGKLAKYLFAKESNELFFEYLAREDLTKSKNIVCQLLKDAEEHDIFLKKTVKETQKEILIVSPWVTLTAIQQTQILPIMEAAVKNGIKISVYTDYELNTNYSNSRRNNETSEEVKKIMSQFQDKGIDARFVKKVHSKLVIKDSDLLCIGSFNWFSAQRKGNYVRHETSLIYQGKNDNLVNEIQLLKESLSNRLMEPEGS